MINMRVSANDGFHRELVASQKIEHAANFITGINNQGFAGDGVADDGTIALQDSHGDGDVDQSI